MCRGLRLQVSPNNCVCAVVQLDLTEFLDKSRFGHLCVSIEPVWDDYSDRELLINSRKPYPYCDVWVQCTRLGAVVFAGAAPPTVTSGSDNRALTATGHHVLRVVGFLDNKPVQKARVHRLFDRKSERSWWTYLPAPEPGQDWTSGYGSSGSEQLRMLDDELWVEKNLRTLPDALSDVSCTDDNGLCAVPSYSALTYPNPPRRLYACCVRSVIFV
jgi:hypothetical protein